MNGFHPDFESECRLCGLSPCVMVEGHQQPATELCGFHFFHSDSMIHWEDWNDSLEEIDD